MDLDLTRTRAALAAHDAALAALGDDATVADVERLDALAAAVGEAFAADTADRNDPAVARTLGPACAWLRALAEAA